MVFVFIKKALYGVMWSVLAITSSDFGTLYNGGVISTFYTPFYFTKIGHFNTSPSNICFFEHYFTFSAKIQKRHTF